MVIFGYLVGFCDRKVSKRSSLARDYLARWARVASPRPGIARPHAGPGQLSTKPPRALSSSAAGLACGSPSGRSRGRHTLPTRAADFWWLANPEACPLGEGRGWWAGTAFADVALRPSRGGNDGASGARTCQWRRFVVRTGSWVDGDGEVGPVASVAIFGFAEDPGHRSKALRVRQTNGVPFSMHCSP